MASIFKERIRMAIENDPYLPLFMRVASRIDSILESPQQIRNARKDRLGVYTLRWNISDLIGEEGTAALFAGNGDLAIYRLCKYLQIQFSGRWMAFSGVDAVVADVSRHVSVSHGGALAVECQCYLDFIP